MTLAVIAEEWRNLGNSEQAQFSDVVAGLFKEGFVWRDDEGDRLSYNFLVRRESLVSAYLAIAGWELRHDERLKLFHLVHPEGAHRRRLTKETTLWLLVLRLLYAEQQENRTVFLTRYPVASVGEIIGRYTSYFGAQAQRKKTRFEDAMRELKAMRLIMPAEGRAIRASDPDLAIELLPTLEVFVPAASVAAAAGRLDEFRGGHESE